MAHTVCQPWGAIKSTAVSEVTFLKHKLGEAGEGRANLKHNGTLWKFHFINFIYHSITTHISGLWKEMLLDSVGRAICFLTLLYHI